MFGPKTDDRSEFGSATFKRYLNMIAPPNADPDTLAPTTPPQASSSSSPASKTSIESSTNTLVASESESDSSPACLYAIRPTPYGGRGAFANRRIPKGTVVLDCEAPYASVVCRKFKKEVCVWCFSWCFESGDGTRRKGSWSVRLSVRGEAGKEKERAWTPWFCSEGCRDRWAGAYAWGGLEGNKGGEGLDALVDVNATLEKTLLNYRAAKVKAKSKPANTQKTTLNHPLTHLDSWTAKANMADVTGESVDWWWTLAETTTSPGNMKKPGKIMDIMEAWNEVSGDGTEDLLTEYEADCARFVLDGLVRHALETSEGAAAATSTPGTGAGKGSEGVDVDAEEVGNRKTAGRWPDLLELQDNELQHVKSRPYMLSCFIRVYLFLKYVVLTARPSRRGNKKSRSPTPAVVEGEKQADVPEAAAFTSLFDALDGILEKSESVRAILARDHGNVFGIWEKGLDVLDGGEETREEDEDGEMLGWGMYVFGSYFNHDCTPTLKKMQHGRSLHFTTTRDIEEGEELCINYIDVSKGNGVVKRNEEVSKGWFFVCGCARCERERKELAVTE
ncbi:hypothetical protein D9611_009139 [Ephemerocybe angulata]|uniref:SET domain-containing protein n=1 Tax=Ephemerocybe angulata TaxID=980116 RepID=A0A8H5FKB0_9AGAR|nr:hypothetical protein D9611_009139 [Tulosesus angulatus]